MHGNGDMVFDECMIEITLVGNQAMPAILERDRRNPKRTRIQGLQSCKEQA
jgi:hypothetical protein